MGREIRRVVPNWEHPKEMKWNILKYREEERYKPLYDRPYLPAITEWIEGHQKWEAGEDPDRAKYPGTRFYAEWSGGPPDVEYYRPDWREEEMTWLQAYETVSEGTPVSPPFATPEELIEYLVKHGDFWDQNRREEQRLTGQPCVMGCGPWSRGSAERFVRGGMSLPSMVVVGGKGFTGPAIFDALPNPATP